MDVKRKVKEAIDTMVLRANTELDLLRELEDLHEETEVMLEHAIRENSVHVEYYQRLLDSFELLLANYGISSAEEPLDFNEDFYD